jgi:hypothetical protein
MRVAEDGLAAQGGDKLSGQGFAGKVDHFTSVYVRTDNLLNNR